MNKWWTAYVQSRNSNTIESSTDGEMKKTTTSEWSQLKFRAVINLQLENDKSPITRTWHDHRLLCIDLRKFVRVWLVACDRHSVDFFFFKNINWIKLDIIWCWVKRNGRLLFWMQIVATHTLDTRSSGFCSWIAKGKLPLRRALVVEHHQQYMAIAIFIYYCRELVSFLEFLVMFPPLRPLSLSFSLARWTALLASRPECRLLPKKG